MPTISLDTVKSLVNYLTVSGVERTVLLQQISLSEQQLNQSGELIDIENYELLYKIAEQELVSKNIGFEFGKTIEPSHWGLLGYIAFTSPTLKAALINHQKYQTLVGNQGTPVQEFQQSNMLLKWIPAYHCSHHTAEEIITGWVAMAKKLSNNIIQPLTIYFNHSCKTNIEQYEMFFGCEVRFESDYNAIEIEKAILDTPYTRYDHEIYNLLCQHASKRINNLVEKSPVEVITQFIRNQLPLGVPEIDVAAQNLQISVRTLQRKLGEHQLTFSGLIDAIRQDLAITYLKTTSTKVIYITHMLGFSEQSAFQRAFKRWTNQTPKQFRDMFNSK